MTSPAPRRTARPPGLPRLARAVAAAHLGALAGPSCADDAAPLFDGAWIPRIEIRLAEGAADRLRAEPRTRVPCTLAIRPLGDEGAGPEIHEEVAIRLKGSAGSFQGLDDKPGFTLDMDAWRDGRRFHGLDKFHLNNAAQDPTFLHEWLGGELFRAAGIPAARVAHARVILDDRDLGVYVLKEALDRDFLERHFDRPEGNLYDGNGVDLDGLAERDEGRIGPPGADVARLVEACRTEDPAARRALVDERLDVEQFIGFMAMELATAHWDGATTGANNYRVYFDPARDGRAVYIPHGMDQLFGDPWASTLDMPPSMLSGSVMKRPEWRKLYRKELKELLPSFDQRTLLRKVDPVQDRIQDALRRHDKELAQAQADRFRELFERVGERHRHLAEEVKAPEPKPLQFKPGIAVKLRNWRPHSEVEDASIEEVSQDRAQWMVVRTGASGRCIAGWRRGVLLERGKYKFEALVKTEKVEALSEEDAPAKGAAVRISGEAAARDLLGSATKILSFEFEVVEEARDVELVIELRASRGEAQVRMDSIQLTRLLGG